MSHVIKDFVIDYNSYAEENLMEYELYEEGLTYRYVYGVDKLGVTAYPIPNGSASVTTAEGTIPLYYHMDHMGSSEFLTSDVTQRVTSWTSYDEWGNITHNAVLKCGQRELDLVKTYTGHERDGVLGMYYAKARLYDTADKHGSTKGNKLGDKRFMAVDPVKGNVRNPQSMVQYTYVQNNPILYVDPLGRMNYLTQSDDLISGAWMGVKESGAETLEAIKNIPQVPSMIYELVTGVYNQEIDMMELAKAMVKDGFSDATYLVNEINVINPFQANTNEEVSLYGKALGKSVTDIALAFVGGKVGKTVLDVLQKSKAGRRVLELATEIKPNSKGYYSKVQCPTVNITEPINHIDLLYMNLQLFIEQKSSNQLAISKNVLKHINSSHNPNVYAKQLSFKNPGVVMIELQNKSFFNKNWDVSMIQEAVNYGYNIAASQGLNRQNEYIFQYNGEKITIGFDTSTGVPRTAFGDYKYTYQELLQMIS